MYFQLVPSTHRTEETEYGLLPTPRAQEIENSNQRIKEGKIDCITTMAKKGLLPTPTAIQREHPERVEALKETGATSMFSRANGEARPNSIIDHLQFHGLLPTPTAMDSTDATATMKSSQVKEGSMHSETLCRAMAMGMLPTPVSGEWMDTGEKVKGNNYKQQNLTRTIANASEEWTGINSQLNPQFVLEMMGFPPDWTLLPFLNGETNQSKLGETQ
jgi:hypothetical protein